MRRSRDTGTDVIFIRQKFEILAAIAWHGYEKAGRGFVLITCDAENVFPAEKNALEITGMLLANGTRALYIPFENLDKCQAKYPVTHLEEVITGYDIRREIVVVIPREDKNGWNVYRFIGSSLPAIAYQKMKSYLTLLQNSLQLFGATESFSGYTCELSVAEAATD